MPIPAVSMEKWAVWVNFSASASDSFPKGEVKYHQKKPLISYYEQPMVVGSILTAGSKNRLVSSQKSACFVSVTALSV